MDFISDAVATAPGLDDDTNESEDVSEVESGLDGGSDEGLDLTPGVEDTYEPVRTYLREMGTVSLLTRQQEVTLAKRIERGEDAVLKAISRSPLVWKEVIRLK